ncbi:hypothetical protein DICPUDRAFT_80482 [Dictyostelium purpureum]|uniref:Uncharacterized protein n=1 Tax=Dictyostelium purpureum TaxID=5786 RepID=F0ZQL6_DICPU|nr:uncharacterized protein DICPUDRAFT_80482 [Dictyostelium purpureum]EGC33774.1 hypothetical protein DICPUDRAFT_80482 [Dictyostelium purpureum]|eukprot:XP_003289699.1 hypothetical protein DICPUDRAFT_80482 [Dictyostelium purpureum]
MNINCILNKGTFTTLTLLKLEQQQQLNEGPNPIDSPSSYDLYNNKKSNQIMMLNTPMGDGPDPINFLLNESQFDTFERQKSFLKKTKIFSNEVVDQYFHHYNHLSFGEKIFTLSGYQLCQNNNTKKPFYPTTNNYDISIEIQGMVKSILSNPSLVYYRIFDLKESSFELGFVNYNLFTIYKEIIDIFETLSIVNHYKGTNIYKWNGGYHVNKILENLLDKRITFEPNEKSKEINNILKNFIINKKVKKNFISLREKAVWDVLVSTNIIKIVNNGNDFIINDENTLF